ncbi:hypothetical protein BH18ACI5_BH18ACI5_19480 [soil metagenome]
MSGDGRWILFSEQGAGGGPGYATYLRSTDGAPAVRLGKGDAQSLSFDGTWAAAIELANHTLNLLPTGAGQPRVIPNHGMTSYSWAGFLPGDKSIIFVGTDKGGVNRVYVEALESGTPRPLTPDGVTISRNTVSPDGKWLAASDQEILKVYPIGGGEPRGVEGSLPGDNPLRWNTDGSLLYVGAAAGSSIQVFAINMNSGKRAPALEVAPRDRVGAGGIQDLFLTADGRGYAFGYVRVLQNLYLIKNLR